MGVQFVARSGMEDALAAGVLRGRPFGGVSIAWSKDLNHLIKPLANYRHKRVVCVELMANPSPILLASIYMPFFKQSNRDRCIVETIDAISILDNIISDHPLHKIILGGDLNTELTGNSPFDAHWREFSEKHNLVLCDSLVSVSDGGVGGDSPPYTYIHQTLDQKKWNDHFFISSSIASQTSDHQILDAGDNLSDHLPIMLKLLTLVPENPVMDEVTALPPSLKWDKCKEEEKQEYAGWSIAVLLNHLPYSLTAKTITVRMKHALHPFKQSMKISPIR